MTTIKISFNDDMRRFTLSGEEARGMATYSNFVQTVQGLFPSLAGREFSLHWYDDDGDKITVSSELEFQEALRFMREQSRTTGKNIVRFEVVAQDGSTPAADSASTAGASVSEAVHVGVTCDECGMSPIRGLRFKCTVREDYDLCAACEARREQPYPMVKMAQPGQGPAALFYAFREDGPRHGGPPPCGGRGGGRRGPWRAARGRCPWGAQLADVLGVPTGKEHEERAKRCRERWQRKAEHVGRHVEETVRPFVEAMDRIFGEDNKTNPAASDATATPSAQTEEAQTTLEEQLMQEAIQESLLLNEVAQAFSAAEISPVESQSTATAAAVPPPPPPLTTSSAPIMTKPALRFVKDVTFPDGAAVQPGAVLRKVWKVRNDGAGTWPEGCVLTTAGGDLLCAEDLTVPLPSVVSGAESEIGVELRAPELPGMYTAYFRAQTREGQSFGHRLWATLQVQEIEEAWTAVTKPDAELGVNSQATSPSVSPAASTVTPVAPAALPPVASAVSAVPAPPAVSTTPVASTPSVASTASTPAPVQPLQLLWRRELSMLADMGFVDAEAALPLLQRHLVTPVSLSGDRGAPPSVEGMQRVVAALLGM